MVQSSTTDGRRKNACSVCARRKVKCDKAEPCSNCVKAQTECTYEAPVAPRPRKRAIEDDLADRLAAYEELMRKHNINFTPFANSWISSGLEAPLKLSGSPSPGREPRASQHPAPKVGPAITMAEPKELCLWSTLSPELKHPPIQSLRHKDDPCLHPTPPLEVVVSGVESPVHALHPEPRLMYRLWQIFVDSVNPLIKIVHVPTLQQRIMEASWDPATIPRPLSATLFAVYALAVTSISSEACQASFGEPRAALLTRYRAAAMRALVAADFLTTRDFEVMQAFVLFLFANPESELTLTLTGAAKRLGQKMGLHNVKADPKLSCFDREMRNRLWWILLGLDSRTRAMLIPGTKPPLPDLGNLRLPLNINDADLHPDMTELPTEYNTPTEMMCVLMKYEVPNWLTTSATAAKVFQTISQGPTRGHASMELEDDAINELEAIYREKYFRNCDKRIPLHAITQTMAELGVARMRFKLHHPRGRPAASGGEVYLTREENDIVFESALTSLEMVYLGTSSKFSPHLFTHLTTMAQMDAYIYVASELRRRFSGERVELAWRLIQDLYANHAELIETPENTFFSAFGGLILEAWEARRREQADGRGVLETQAAPEFIQLLEDRRSRMMETNSELPFVFPNEGMDDGSNGNYLDWEYWNDFLRL